MSIVRQQTDRFWRIYQVNFQASDDRFSLSSCVIHIQRRDMNMCSCNCFAVYNREFCTNSVRYLPPLFPTASTLTVVMQIRILLQMRRKFKTGDLWSCCACSFPLQLCSKKLVYTRNNKRKQILLNRDLHYFFFGLLYDSLLLFNT